MKRIVITSIARKDIEGATLYLADRDNELALRFIDARERSIYLVRDSPAIGRVIELEGFANPRMWFVRDFRRYLIF